MEKKTIFVKHLLSTMHFAFHSSVKLSQGRDVGTLLSSFLIGEKCSTDTLNLSFMEMNLDVDLILKLLFLSSNLGVKH